jgi:UDP-N-acetylmuramate--alanine ligase
VHLYFSGIGGSGLSALANIALDMGFMVSGSDLEENSSIQNLRQRGANIHIGQKGVEIEMTQKRFPIYWFIHSSSIPKSHPEFLFATKNNLKVSKRDEFINFVIKKNNLKLIAVAGTHGKTTTTAMIAWLFKEYNQKLSYVIGSQLPFGNNGKQEEDSKFLLLEADEYDRHFLNYQPFASILTSLDYDHQDIYPTKDDYTQAFEEFLQRSEILVAFGEDLQKLKISPWREGEDSNKPKITELRRNFGGKIATYKNLKLPGLHNRQNAALAKTLFNQLFENKIETEKLKEIEQIISKFPGTSRRMEKLANNLYTDYAHHPAEIAASLQMAKELNPKVVAVYQPHQNSRQHEIKNDYKNAFEMADKILWLPTYQTRENKDLTILKPFDLINLLTNKKDAQEAQIDDNLWQKIKEYLKDGFLVVVMGAGDVDKSLRKALEENKLS